MQTPSPGDRGPGYREPDADGWAIPPKCRDVSVDEILRYVIQIPFAEWDQRARTRVARILVRLGFERYQRRLTDGRREWRYRRKAEW